jgi:hypothetical protein
MDMNFVNLTPHAIKVLAKGEPTLVVPPSGAVARVIEVATPLGTISEYVGQPVCVVEYGRVEGLPDEDIGEAGEYRTYFIVSSMVIDAVEEHPGSYGYRKDLLCPFDMVRDGRGVIVGCRGFRRVM